MRTTRRELTERQKEVLDAFRGLEAAQGSTPTIRAVCAAVGIGNPNGLLCHYRALEKKGYMARPASGGRRVWRLARDGDGVLPDVEGGLVALPPSARKRFLTPEEARDLARRLRQAASRAEANAQGQAAQPPFKA